MKQRADLTFKHNRNLGRHGWLRLTPAYSVKLVSHILDHLDPGQVVLEPFSGTGTTGITAAQHGFECDLVDINPFLIWLASTKTRNYTKLHREEFIQQSSEICRLLRKPLASESWKPNLHNIERWWFPNRLSTLSELWHRIDAVKRPAAVSDLLRVAFCRTMIDWSNAAFNHQSMSFQEPSQTQLDLDERPEMLASFHDTCTQIAEDVAQPLRGKVSVVRSDSRTLEGVDENRYTSLITSPPYPNRMSYIRELRPYMYWLGFLDDAREAGEMDWLAIGGTWGCATSRVLTWEPAGYFERSHPLVKAVDEIKKTSPLLANYVHKYFEDMLDHCRAVRKKMKRNGHVFYIVGNSKFYDTIVPVEEYYADMLKRSGFADAHIDRIRKRNSKKELYEFVVSATAGTSLAGVRASTRSRSRRCRASCFTLTMVADSRCSRARATGRCCRPVHCARRMSVPHAVGAANCQFCRWLAQVKDTGA